MVVAQSRQTQVTRLGRGPVPPTGIKVSLQGSKEKHRCKEKRRVSRQGSHARSPLPSPPLTVPPAPALPSFATASPREGKKKYIKFPNFQNTVLTMSCCCTCFLSTERAVAAHLPLQRRAWPAMINSRTQWSTSEPPVCQGACFPCLSCTASF